MKSGEIKATALNEPIASLAREQGVNVMVDLVPEQIPWLFSGIVVRRSSLASAPRRADALPQGDDRGQLSGAHRRDARQGGAGQGAEDHRSRRSSTSATTTSSSSRRSTSSRRGRAPRTSWRSFPGGSSKLDDYIDTSLLDELKKDGFFAALQQKYGKRDNAGATAAASSRARLDA